MAKSGFALMGRIKPCLRVMKSGPKRSVCSGLQQVIVLVDVSPAGGRHWSSTTDAAHLAERLPAASLRILHSAAHGGDPFWDSAVPVAARRRQTVQKVERCVVRRLFSFLWFGVPEISLHFPVHGEPPVRPRHGCQRFLATGIDFAQRILEGIRVKLGPIRKLLRFSSQRLPVRQSGLIGVLSRMTLLNRFEHLAFQHVGRA
jgi:hypothetical protein